MWPFDNFKPYLSRLSAAQQRRGVVVAPPSIEDQLPAMPPRPRSSHKGDYGKLLVIGGSPHVALAAQAALRSGVAIVRVMVPEQMQGVVAQYDPCYMTTPLPHIWPSGHRNKVLGRLHREYNVIVLCPGVSPMLLHTLYTESHALMVVHPEVFSELYCRDVWDRPSSASIVLFDSAATRKFMGKKSSRESAAARYARETACVGVSEAFPSMVDQGVRRLRLNVGHGGMYVDGADYVHCGIMAGVLSSTLIAPYESACLGTYIYGVAGDFAAITHGEVSVIPTDIVSHIPSAFRAYFRVKN